MQTPPKPTRSDSYREYLNREGPKAPGSKEVPVVSISFYLYMYSSIYLFIHSSFHLSIPTSIYLYIHSSIYASTIYYLSSIYL